MNTCPWNFCALKLNRIKYRYRIYQPCPWRTPFNLSKMCYGCLISPLKCHWITWKLSRSSKWIAICDIIIQYYKSVWWKIIIFYLIFKPHNCVFEIFWCHFFVFNYRKSLFFKPFKLYFPWILKILSICINKRKCKKSYISFFSNLIIKLTYWTAAKISWILIFCIYLRNLFIDFFKVRISYNCLSSYNKSAFKRNWQRNIFKYFCILCNNFPNFAISSCYSF